jgi:flagellin-like hook-associated protein FlgL
MGSATLGEEQLASDPKSTHSLLSAAAAIGAGATVQVVSALALAINSNADSKFWARVETANYRSGYSSIYIYAKEGGDKHNVSACDEQLGDIRSSAAQRNKIVWYNDEVESNQSAGTFFNNGGKYWGTIKAVPTGYGSWGVQLHGLDVGDDRDLWILNVGSGANFDIRTDRASAYTGSGFGQYAAGVQNYKGVSLTGGAITNMQGLDRLAFVQIQDAADGAWAGAEIRTQSSAQEALEAIQGAIERKDKIRATLGAYQNRLENTITNLEIQAENLQASESRISDVDMATEMTNFVKNQVLTQAAVSMLSQANSLPQMALSLLNG